MRLIPVIDLLNNQAVHAVKGDRACYRPVKSVVCNTSDPLEIAGAFRDRLGLSEIYIADLDAIGNPLKSNHRNLIETLSSEEKIDVILDAGVSDAQNASQWLDLGVHKIVIGSETLKTLDALKEIPSGIDPKRIIFSLDCRNGRILSKCSELESLSPIKALEYVQSSGWREIILLDLARVGSGYGIDRSFVVEARTNFPEFTLLVGPAQRAVAMAVADCVEDGTIPEAEAEDIFVMVGVFIHWEAKDDAKIQDFNYEATKLSIKRAVAGEPKAAEVLAKKGEAAHPFAAHQ